MTEMTIKTTPFCTFILIFGILNNHIYCNKNQTTHYEKLITEAIDSALQYTFPTNNFKEKPIDDEEEDFGTFDFIIVGSGTSGSVLARRLSEIPKWKILLLEAGSFGNEITDIPAMAFNTHFSDYNWGYLTVPQNNSCLDMLDQRCFYPRGKGIGGTSLINAVLYSRGSPTDFDEWGAENAGWSYKDVLQYFTISEHLEKTDSDAIVDTEYHGLKGPLNVEYRIPRHPLVNVWLQANQEKGFKIVDLNAENSTGASVSQFTLKNGKRQDTGTAFIKPVKNRENLHISTGSHVTKLLINNETKIAEAVQFVNKNKKYIAYARNEIILSAGAVGTPQILMLSGVGPKKHLEDLNIPVVADLNVGRNLREHPAYWGLSFETNYTDNEQPLENYIKEFLDGKGGLTVANEITGIGYYRLSPYLKPKELDVEILTSFNDGFNRYYINDKLNLAKQKTTLNLQRPPGFTTIVLLQKPKSVGSVQLKNKDSFEFPLIDPQFLADFENKDIETLYQGIQHSLDLILNSEAFKRMKTTLFRQKLPDCDTKPYLSKEYWYCAIRHFTWSAFHPMGTCAMGSSPEKGAVVDKNCKVHGIKKLRVVDASIYPIAVSGHPMAHCIMFGEKISDVIKQDYVKSFETKTEL